MSIEREREATELTDLAKQLNLEAGRNSLERGRIYRRVKEAQLFKEAGYESFPKWLEAVGDDGKSWAYSLIDLYSELEATVPEDSIKNMTAANARDLTALPEKKRSDPSIIAAAQEMSNKRFREVLNVAQPGLALEEKQFKSFKMDKNAQSVVMDSVRLVIEESGGTIKTEGAAIEYVCNEWMQTRGTRLNDQRREVLAWYRTVERIINELLPVLRFPNAMQWAQMVLAAERVRNVFGFSKADAVGPTKPPRKPRVPAEPERGSVTNRLQ